MFKNKSPSTSVVEDEKMNNDHHWTDETKVHTLVDKIITKQVIYLFKLNFYR